MVKAKYSGPTDRLQLYESAVARVEDMELKGATMPYTSRDGHMTSFLDSQGSVAIRLDEPDRVEFLERHESSIAVQYGREMKEFAVVPDTLLEDTDTVSDWLRRSYEWVGTLKPN